MQKLTFEPETHTYHLGSRRLPSVSQVLKAAGVNDGEWYTPEAAQRGTNIHTLCDSFDRIFDDDPTDFDWDAVPEEYREYLGGWAKFRLDTHCRIVASEVPVFNEAYGYAGRLDKIVKYITGLVGVELIDIKTGTPQEWHRLQTAAYRMAVPDRPLRRACVYLTPAGTYKWIEHKNRDDEAIWKAALVIARWRMDYIPGVDRYDDYLNRNSRA
jgi:hypothetical protein